MLDDPAADGQQFTAEIIEQMYGNDGEDDDWKLPKGNYTKVDVTINVMERCDQRKDQLDHVELHHEMLEDVFARS